MWSIIYLERVILERQTAFYPLFPRYATGVEGSEPWASTISMNGTDKAIRNLEKHRVTFEESATIFDDLEFITVVDDEHSLDEERYVSIGMSNRGRLLMVAHTDRSGRIRIISAREATKREERFYAESAES